MPSVSVWRSSISSAAVSVEEKTSPTVSWSTPPAKKTPEKRLDILNKSNDGFYIASEDLKLRGPGDLFGVRQSGDLEFHLADIFADADILKAVSDEVKKLMDKDPLLEAEENQELKRKMNGYLERGWEKVNL